MADLRAFLSSIGLDQYHQRLVEAGFDRWETILDITEDDLEHLGVKRGHRRQLQQEIAYTLRLGNDPGDQRSKALSRSVAVIQSSQGSQSNQKPPLPKRQYTRHPRPDPDAPQRPPSAYVLFSNAVRDELKDDTLSFADKSKTVGDRWRNLTDESRENWKQRASGPQEKYKADWEQYQNSESHRDYQSYVTDFNASQPAKKRRAPSANTGGDIPPEQTLQRSPPSASDQSTGLRRLAPAGLGVPFPAVSTAASSSRSPSDGKRESKPNLHKGPSPPRSGQGIASHRHGHACESCKKKKLRCDGAVPSCSRCARSGLECIYEGGIRDRERRLVEDMAGKLGAYEDALRRIKPDLENDDQSEISQLLLRSPRTEYERTMSSGQASRSTMNESIDGVDDESGGESDASGVGSMGSTDHLNEDFFACESGPGRIDSFLGQSATDNWVRRLEDSLAISTAEEEASGLKPQSALNSMRPRSQGDSGRPNVPEVDGFRNRSSMFVDHSNPYQLPPKLNADTFVNAYFTTVHPTFPILNRAQFLQSYEHFYSCTDSNEASNSAFAMLHIVLAIGAIHTFATQVPWARRERSWNVAGLGVRCAQALGMYLANVTPQMTASQKNLRLSIWYSILSFERTISVITGRPSMVRDGDCSATLPHAGFEDPDKHVQDSIPDANSHLWSHVGDASTPASLPPAYNPAATIDPMFFVHHVELSSIADMAMSTLYSARSRRTRWSELQGIIENLNLKLDDWNAKLPQPFQTDWNRQKAEGHSSRVAVGMLFHSTSIVINRPCLCRLDRRIANQSSASNQANIDSANRCVASARAILALVPDPPDPAMIYHGPLWWMAFHHLKRATTVLILEITFMSEHTAAADADILIDAKKAIAWLHALGMSSSPAYSSWIILSRLLVRAAEKFGGDLGDAIIAGEEEDPAAGSSEGRDLIAGAAAAEGEQRHQLMGMALVAEDPTAVFSGADPRGVGVGGERGGGLFFGGELALEGWDQFEPGRWFTGENEFEDMMEEGG
ncbi:MAG: hypothetical protein LQ350_005400 [Teloschistes chrysophthalmus]|nr:MAG: hypothetical protein LQ350_005400 [Niorma chrysophthalma]